MRIVRVALAVITVAPFGLVAGSAHALDQGDFLARVRFLWIDPQDSSSGISPDLPTAHVGVGSAPTGELDFSYMFTENIGTELILAAPVHDLKGRDSIASLGRIGDTELLPPVLSVQYHFMPKNWIRPYVGIGVNYTIFFNEDPSTSLNTALGGPTKISIDDSVGPAGQVGVDIDITDRIFLNLDVKYVNISPGVTLTTGNTIRHASVDINPLIIGVGVGTRF